MAKILFAVWAITSSALVYASCTTSTVTYGGRMVTCTTCCYGGVCNTNCF
jgi:hypothetical protein